MRRLLVCNELAPFGWSLPGGELNERVMMHTERGLNRERGAYHPFSDPADLPISQSKPIYSSHWLQYVDVGLLKGLPEQEARLFEGPDVLQPHTTLP